MESIPSTYIKLQILCVKILYPMSEKYAYQSFGKNEQSINILFTVKNE